MLLLCICSISISIAKRPQPFSQSAHPLSVVCFVLITHMYDIISNFLCAFNCLLFTFSGAFLSLFFLIVFSSTRKKTRVPSTAGNSAQTTRGRRNEWHKKEVRRSVYVGFMLAAWSIRGWSRDDHSKRGEKNMKLRCMNFPFQAALRFFGNTNYIKKEK